MNNARRKEIVKAESLLSEALAILETCADDEREAFDNMPEGLQASERGQAAESAADALERARDSTQEAIDAIGEIEQ